MVSEAFRPNKSFKCDPATTRESRDAVWASTTECGHNQSFAGVGKTQPKADPREASTDFGSSMHLYTFILEFEGGTYVSQVEADSVEVAPSAWAAGIALGNIQGLAAASAQELRDTITDEVPVQLKGLQEVWCISALVHGRLALVHFVSTARKQ